MALLFGCSTVVVLFSIVSLACLIIATITAPATSLALAQAEDLKYGVFGYCTTGASSTCTTGSPWYTVSDLTELTDWKMGSNARDTLAKILIVTPIAAGLTLISFLFNLFSHFKVFGCSLAFYIVGFIFALLAFFGAAITCIVVFLLFYPHVQWPSWLLIPAGVLNLLSVPLVFFAMKTNPTSSHDSDDEEIDRENLTDLSDGDNFKNESFKMNDFSAIPRNDSYSTEKINVSAPAIKVLTDDSSYNGSNYEKVSMRDYSRNATTNPEASAFRSYNYAGQDSTLESANEIPMTDDGTPNLISSQNYTRGAVRTEAVSVQPQSVKPDFGGNTPTYQSSQYSSGSAHPIPPASLKQPQYSFSSSTYQASSSDYQKPQGYQQPTTESYQASSGSYDQPSSSVYQKNSQPSSNEYAASGALSSFNQASVPYPLATFDNTGSNAVGSSNHNSIPDDIDYDNDINDNGSDFTSVSQRAANPRYYRGMQPNGPTLFPPQMQQQQQLQLQLQQQQQQQPLQHIPQNSQVPMGYAPQGQFIQSNPQGGQTLFNGSYAPPQPQSQGPVKDTSDYLLSNNPDFRIGGPASQRPNTRKASSPAIPGGYRPAYKRLQSGQKGLPAASLSADSPYNIR
jgi:hypothetical protein